MSDQWIDSALDQNTDKFLGQQFHVAGVRTDSPVARVAQRMRTHHLAHLRRGTSEDELPVWEGSLAKFIEDKDIDIKNVYPYSTNYRGVACATCKASHIGQSTLTCTKLPGCNGKVQGFQTGNALFSMIMRFGQLPHPSISGDMLPVGKPSMIGIRLETPHILVIDDFLRESAIHWISFWTAAPIPHWLHLLQFPAQGLAVIETLKDAADKVLKENFYDDEEFKDVHWKGLEFEHVKGRRIVCGFNFPPSQTQLHLQYQSFPSMPKETHHYQQGGHVQEGKYSHYEWVQAVLIALRDNPEKLMPLVRNALFEVGAEEDVPKINGQWDLTDWACNPLQKVINLFEQIAKEGGHENQELSYSWSRSKHLVERIEAATLDATTYPYRAEHFDKLVWKEGSNAKGAMWTFPLENDDDKKAVDDFLRGTGPLSDETKEVMRKILKKRHPWEDYACDPDKRILMTWNPDSHYAYPPQDQKKWTERKWGEHVASTA